MIDFELSPEIENARQMIHMLAEQTMRPISREYDEREHEKPTEWHNMMWTVSQGSTVGFGGGDKSDKDKKEKKPVGAQPGQRRHHRGALLGRRRALPEHSQPRPRRRRRGRRRHARAEQRFLARFQDGRAEVGGDGDHRAGLRLRLRRHHQHRGARRRPVGAERHQDLLHQRPSARSRSRTASWSSGRRSTSRPAAPASRPSSSRHGTPGMTVTKVEDKLGIRASDTAHDRLRGLPHPARQPARQRRGEDAVERGLQGRHGDLRRHPPGGRRQRHRHRPRRGRLRPRGARPRRASRSATTRRRPS